MKIKNRDRLRKKIAALPRAVRDELRAALQSSAQEMVATAKAMAPFESGDLRDSIDFSFGEFIPDNSNVRGVSASGGGHDLSVTIHAGNERAFYAAFVEFGTAPHNVAKGAGTKVGQIKARFGRGRLHPGAKAQPFFFPAYRLTKRRAKSRITRAINKAAKRVAGGT